MSPLPAPHQPPEQFADRQTEVPIPAVYQPQPLTGYPPHAPQPVPSVTSVVLPDGQVVTGYTTAQPAPLPVVDTRVSGRAKGAALVIASGGIGVGGATAGIGYGLGLIATAGPGLLTAAIALAIATGSATLLRLLLGSGARSADRSTTVVHQHVTSHGLFGRATGGTITRH
ncbi:hypothetical protein [Actinacidiphila acididurans]|uniref:Uncharacterized protein n=1 Tax=Actinacidiphila acididurans TaxID=2784346 RepID=A0ABS2TSU7_9ACTN|nr:hypothetical protein [Actinacidiphila acididurans]MBM9505043.1 hypothetical protein [Actinacidiphila acididurans]